MAKELPPDFLTGPITKDHIKVAERVMNEALLPRAAEHGLFLPSLTTVNDGLKLIKDEVPDTTPAVSTKRHTAKRRARLAPYVLVAALGVGSGILADQHLLSSSSARVNQAPVNKTLPDPLLSDAASAPSETGWTIAYPDKDAHITYKPVTGSSILATKTDVINFPRNGNLTLIKANDTRISRLDPDEIANGTDIVVSDDKLPTGEINPKLVVVYQRGGEWSNPATVTDYQALLLRTKQDPQLDTNVVEFRKPSENETKYISVTLSDARHELFKIQQMRPVKK